MTSTSNTSGLGRAYKSGLEAVRGEEVGKEKASWVDMVIFRRALAFGVAGEKRLENQPMIDSEESKRLPG